MVSATVIAACCGSTSSLTRPTTAVTYTNDVTADRARSQLIGIASLHGVAFDLRDALTCDPDRDSFESIRHECKVASGDGLLLSGVALWPVVTWWHRVSGHADTFEETEVVMLLAQVGATLQPVHGVIQWQQNTSECSTTVLRQHYRTADITGDGKLELCVETVREVGTVADHGTMSQRPWHPKRRRRTLRAYRHTPSAAAVLSRAPALDSQCPSGGYKTFAPPTKRLPATRGRGLTPGGPLCSKPCPGAWEDRCGNPYFDDEANARP